MTAAPVGPPVPRTKVTGAKSARTRTQIVDAAMRLFRERGYDRTTMRAVAEAAGVSVGNTYYYFGSKEELIQGFYDHLVAEHIAASRVALEQHTDLGDRIRGVLDAWLDVAEPYHAFAGRFFAAAAQPDNPLSPFSPASTAARDAGIALYDQVLAGSTTNVDESLRPHLPELLWLHQLGIVLFWVHDRSDGLHLSRELATRTATLVSRLVRLSRLRLVRPLAAQVVDVLRLVRGS